MNTTIPTAVPAVLDADSMAVIGRTLHDLRGIRYTDAPGGNAPAATPAAPAAPAEPATPPAGGTVPAPAAAPAAPGRFPGPIERQPAAPAAPAAPTPTAPGATDTPPAAPAAPPARQYTAEETQAHIHQLNEQNRLSREAATAEKNRADAAEAKANAILKAAGFNPDGTPYTELTPEQVQQKLTEQGSTVDTTQRENLLLRTTPRLGADADKLLDSRSFTAELHKLAADDRAGVEALVTKWTTEHPEYKIAPPAAAASTPGGHTGTQPVTGRKTRAQALADKYPKSQGSAR